MANIRNVRITGNGIRGTVGNIVGGRGGGGRISGGTVSGVVADGDLDITVDGRGRTVINGTVMECWNCRGREFDTVTVTGGQVSGSCSRCGRTHPRV